MEKMESKGDYGGEDMTETETKGGSLRTTAAGSGHGFARQTLKEKGGYKS